ncbi:hypothetical protein [Streptomyces sp. CL12-4]|uniref:hypothetical protein n=1 Tax=Streptomyces sp. CL12-4 TaxID=2810306 RepID=UPI001EFADB23|nr:hypothetical protein [Streptomyces sp. CL12-4]MCG8971773.1 hypothetical protein [Streptomyces sp. CL12-4]
MTDDRWSAYRTWIETDGNWRVVGVHELLRVLMGKQRAGARIVEKLEEELAAHNIGHLPPRIPRDQYAQVLLYNKDSSGLGFVMHLTRQLAEGKTPDGTTTDQQVLMIAQLLETYRAAPTEDATSA